jgi:hypothetical protein
LDILEEYIASIFRAKEKAKHGYNRSMEPVVTLSPNNTLKFNR